MVYSHTHNLPGIAGKTQPVTKSTAQTTVTEKCSLCDVMHHNAMVKATPVYFAPAAVCALVFKSTDYNFTSIQLILSGGRAPPSSNYKS